ncbi:MAG: DUF4114 domain-containing protein, partial [Eudoraea sp.]|nr:DUF4114 domain-containing protein [Eudoraea sp.]
TADGTPLYFDEPDVVTQETLQLVADALPEGYPVPQYNPQYITSGYDTDVLLDAPADVWVTFVGEGAGYKNVLGFYTYALDNPDPGVPSPEDITIIFPNVSRKGSGGSLDPGDKVKIGTFPAGTGIGWVLLANGWKGSVTNGLWQLYSNPDYNPEANASLRHHNVLLNDPENERIILGFEDIRRDYGSCDNDFNDALFYITANPYSAIRTTNFNDIADRADVSSGNDGGLESNGDLASLIAKRNFARKKNKTAKNRKRYQQFYRKATYKAEVSKTAYLDRYFPETGMYGTETAFVSSPDDLTGITNADAVFSIDYYQGEERVSAALGIKTTGGVYNHSKTICDRLNGAKLLDVRTVVLQGHELVFSRLERSTGEKEIALTFSILEQGKANQLYSRWNISDYPAGDYLNFQVWGSSMGQVTTVVNHILDTLQKDTPVVFQPTDNTVPQVFVKDGYYANGKLHLNVINKVNSAWLNVDANYKPTEQQSVSNYTTTVPLKGSWEEHLVVESGFLFDAGISIMAEASLKEDIIYLADGPWGVDYNTAVDGVEEFTVTPQEQNLAELDGWMVERGITASGKVKETINFFRTLRPGDQWLDVSDYQYLHFEASNAQEIEISLVTDETAKWEDRLRLAVPPTDSLVRHSYHFSEFKNQENKAIPFNKIKTIVFSVQGDYRSYTPFDLEVNKLLLSASADRNPLEDEEEVDLAEEPVEEYSSSLRLRNYPNPFKERTTIQVPNANGTVELTVTNLAGVQVFRNQYASNKKQPTIEFLSGKLPDGIYIFSVRDVASGKVYRSKMIKN